MQRIFLPAIATLAFASVTLVSAAIAAPDLKSFVGRMPAFPATPQAAGASFGGKILETPVPPKAIGDLEHDLTSMNLDSARAAAPSAGQQQAAIASSQDIATKMAGMTTDQRITYAMQLQAGMPKSAGAMALDANGSRNAQATGMLMQQSAADQQSLARLQGQVTTLVNGWTIQDQKASGSAIFKQRLCTAKDRTDNDSYLAPHLALARNYLGQGAALERQLRALANGAAARSAQAEAMVAQGAQGSMASSAASGARTSVQQAILTMAQLYDGASMAARYQHASDWNAHAPVNGPCFDNGGG